MTPAEITCPKCHYTRQPGDSAPAEECPKCGIIYAKAAARQRPAALKIPAAWQNEEPVPPPVAPEPSFTAPPVDPEPAPMPVSEPPAEKIPQPKLLIDCPACAGQHSLHARACPHCGHPNPDAPNRAGNTAGLIALTLAVSALWMPYFGAPLLIPAAIGAIIIAAYLRAHIGPLLLAGGLVTFALIGVYQTSKKITEASDQAAQSARQAQTEMEIARKRLEQFQRDFGR